MTASEEGVKVRLSPDERNELLMLALRRRGLRWRALVACMMAGSGAGWIVHVILHPGAPSWMGLLGAILCGGGVAWILVSIWELRSVLARAREVFGTVVQGAPPTV